VQLGERNAAAHVEAEHTIIGCARHGAFHG
jgi:hypothetical protein